jgi:hypothetical protein
MEFQFGDVNWILMDFSFEIKENWENKFFLKLIKNHFVLRFNGFLEFKKKNQIKANKFRSDFHSNQKFYEIQKHKKKLQFKNGFEFQFADAVPAEAVSRKRSEKDGL